MPLPAIIPFLTVAALGFLVSSCNRIHSPKPAAPDPFSDPIKNAEDSLAYAPIGTVYSAPFQCHALRHGKESTFDEYYRNQRNTCGPQILDFQNRVMAKFKEGYVVQCETTQNYMDSDKMIDSVLCYIKKTGSIHRNPTFKKSVDGGT